MTVQTQHKPGAKLAQALTIRTHQLVADVSAAGGGDDEGPSPHDLYDAALASCKALTVMWYARRKGLPVEDVQATVERDDSQERHGTYRLTARLLIVGALTDAQIDELAAVAEKCPVHKLMTAVKTEIATVVERQPA